MKFNVLSMAIISLSLAGMVFAENSQSFDLSGMQVRPTITNKMIYKGQKVAVENAGELFQMTADPVLGNPDGRVTLVEFMDFGCPICERVDPVVMNLIKANPDLRVVYKEYPIKGDASIYAAKAGLAAKLQGKYHAFHVAMMRAGHGLTSKTVLQVAKSVGLDIEQMKADMDSSAVEQQIQSTHQLAKQIGILGTPALFFAKTNVSSNQDPDAVVFMMGQFSQVDLQNVIDKIAGKAR